MLSDRETLDISVYEYVYGRGAAMLAVRAFCVEVSIDYTSSSDRS